MPPPEGVVCKWCNGKFLKPSFSFHEKKCEALFQAQHVKCENCDNYIGKDNIKVHTTDCKARTKKTEALKAKSAALHGNVLLSKTAAVSEKISTQPTQATTISLTCEECSENEKAIVHCGECEQSLCGSCDGAVHAKGARVRHVRVAVGKTKDVDEIVPSALLSSNKPVIEEVNVEEGRVPCHFCGRKFAMGRVAIHENVCSQPKKSRKVWEEGKKRIEGTDFEEFKNNRSATPPEILKERKEGNKWRAERERLRSIVEEGNKWVMERKEILRAEIEKQLDAQEKLKQEQAALPSYAKSGKKNTNISLENSKLEVINLGGFGGRSTSKGPSKGGSSGEAFAMNWAGDAEQNLKLQVLEEIMAKRNPESLKPSVAAVSTKSTDLIKKAAVPNMRVSDSKDVKTTSKDPKAPSFESKTTIKKEEKLQPVVSSKSLSGTTSSVQPAISSKDISTSAKTNIDSRKVISTASKPSAVAPKSIVPAVKNSAEIPAKLPSPPTTFVNSENLMPKASLVKGTKPAQMSIDDYRLRELERKKSGTAKSILPSAKESSKESAVPKPPQVIPEPKRTITEPKSKEPLVLGGGRLGGSTKDSYQYSQDKDALRAARADFFAAKVKK